MQAMRDMHYQMLALTSFLKIKVLLLCTQETFPLWWAIGPWQLSSIVSSLFAETLRTGSNNKGTDNSIN